MNLSLVLWALLAIGIFWGVGVYNRLTRLRTRALETFGPVERCMQSYVVLMDTHGHVPAAAEPEWLAVKALARDLESLQKAALQMPLSLRALQGLQAKHADLQVAWKALNDTPADLAGGVIPDTLKVQWEAATLKTLVAWESMQEAVHGLDVAAQQFPASLVAGPMGMKVKK